MRREGRGGESDDEGDDVEYVLTIGVTMRCTNNVLIYRDHNQTTSLSQTLTLIFGTSIGERGGGGQGGEKGRDKGEGGDGRNEGDRDRGRREGKERNRDEGGGKGEDSE